MSNSADRIRLGMRLNRLSNCLRTAMDQRFMRKYGLTAQQTRTILFLYRKTCEDNVEVNQRDLEKFLGLKSPTVTGVLKRLEENGMIKRTVSKKDGRVKILKLTRRGTQVHKGLAEQFDFSEEMLMQGFEEAEIHTLLGYLDRLEENVRALSQAQEQ